MLPTLIAMQSPNDLNGRVTNCLGFRILYPIRPCCHASRSQSLSWEYLCKSRFLAHRISDENLAERQGSDLSTARPNTGSGCNHEGSPKQETFCWAQMIRRTELRGLDHSAEYVLRVCIRARAHHALVSQECNHYGCGLRPEVLRMNDVPARMSTKHTVFLRLTASMACCLFSSGIPMDH